MTSDPTPSKQPSRTLGCALWILALVITGLSITFQSRTGPTYPLEGSVPTAKGQVRFYFLRSQTIGTDLTLLLIDPVPAGVTGAVRYRRYRSRDEWMTKPMQHGDFSFSQRMRSRKLTGLGTTLPSLPERAGKYEFFVDIAEEGGQPVSITGEKPIYARYKAHVPGPVLVLHIAAIFLSMLVAIRTTLAAFTSAPLRRLIIATVATLLFGGFVMGPLVQWYAFGVWWSGAPFGYDWTDNKVLVELAFWLAALWANRGASRDRWSVLLAGVVTLAVYFIPHSIFGSEYDYRTGSGHGTAG